MRIRSRSRLILLGTAVILFFFIGADRSIASLAAQTEKISLVGWLSVIWSDPLASSGLPSETRLFFTEDTGLTTELLIAKELERVETLLALNGRRVAITADPIQLAPFGGRNRLLRVSTIEPAPSTRASVASEIKGNQKWISILCKFSDVSAEPHPLSHYQQMYGKTAPGLDHYWRELSYNAIELEGSAAVGWYSLPHPKAHYLPFDQHTAELANDCMAAADSDVDFTNYIGLNLMLNDKSSGLAGLGGRIYLTKDGESKLWRAAWNFVHDPVVIEHEMGHAFGLPHSYDNPWDIMGGNECQNQDPVYGCLGQHTITYHKDALLGWIPANHKFVANDKGSVSISLERLALPQTNNYKMAQIPIGGSNTHFYTVEARRLAGYDVGLKGDAVVIYEIDTTRNEPAHIIDSDGNGDNWDDGPLWTVGEAFRDNANGIAVSVDSSTSSGYIVTITTSLDCTTKPDKPTLIKPNNGKTVKKLKVKLDWNATNCADTYSVIVSEGFENGPKVQTAKNLSSSQFKTQALSSGKTYFWRVIAKNTSGKAKSDWWSFKVP